MENSPPECFLALGTARVVRLGRSALYRVRFTDYVGTYWPRIDRVPVSGQLSELDAIVGQKSVNLVWHGFTHLAEKLPSGALFSLFKEFGHSELAGVVNADK